MKSASFSFKVNPFTVTSSPVMYKAMLFKTALSLVRVISSEMIIVLTKSENSPWKINSSNSIVSNNIPFSSKNLKKVSLVTILVNSSAGKLSCTSLLSPDFMYTAASPVNSYAYNVLPTTIADCGG